MQRVLGKVGSTISDRPLVGSLLDDAEAPISNAKSSTSPYPYFEVLILNRGYYGYGWLDTAMDT